MTFLTIRTMGVPEVRFQEKQLKFRSRKALALLIYLAVEPGQHSREKLIDLYWPQSNHQQGRVSLRTALSQVRQALHVVGSSIIVSTYDQVQLEPEQPYQLDLDLITIALRPASTADAWHTAVDAIQSQFLEGFSLSDAPDFEAWASYQRQLWHDQLERVYQRLTTFQLDQGEWASAVHTAIQWVAHAPLNETAYRCLMEAQARSGDRAAALLTYNQCRNTLKNELDIDPGSEISALAERIQLDKINNPPIGPDLTVQTTPFHFVGRATEHSQLAKGLHTAVQGSTIMAVIVGNAGTGKTRLAETFINAAQYGSVAVDILYGRAFDLGGRLPYQPLAAAFRFRLEQENAPEDLLDDIWLAELSHLFPELLGRYPDLPPPVTGDADFVRARLFEAVARLGRALAARRPLLIFIDDWQWAENGSRDMLHYLAHSWAKTNTPIFLLITVRQESLLTTPTLQEWLINVDRHLPLTRLELAPFSAADAQQFARLLAAADGITFQPGEEETVQAFGNWLYQETNGHPFFLIELVKMLMEQNILVSIDHDGHLVYNIAAAFQQIQSQPQLPVPPTVRQLLLARQSRLTEEATALLWASAVMGRDCTFERLCQVSGIAELAALSALKELLNGRFILEEKDTHRPYTFAHDYIREVAYTEAGEARRRLFHRRALAALEQDAAPPAELAFHAFAAQMAEPACRYSVAAGDAATQAHAYVEAVSHYDQACELVIAAAAGTQLLHQLFSNRGRALEHLHKDEAAKVNYQEMLELAEARNDLSLKQAALTAQCIIHATHTSLFNPSLAKELGQAALDLANLLNDSHAKAKALWCMMLIEFYGAGDNEKTLAFGNEALALAQELGLKELAAYVQTNLAWAYFNSDQIEAALTANNETRASWQSLGNLPMVADSYTMKLFMCRYSGKYDDLLAAAPEARRLSQSINNNLNETMALQNTGEAQCLQGRFGQALTCIETAAIITEETAEAWATYSYYPAFILIYLQCGALAKAEEWANKLYAFRETFLPIFQTFFLTPIARAKIAKGKDREAEVVLAQNFAVLDNNNPSAQDMVSLYITDAHLQLLIGNPAQALDRMETVIRRLRLIGSRYYLAEAYWLQGKAWLALEKPNLAKEAFLQAKAVAEQISERTILWQILASLIEFESMNGNQPEANKFREQAQEVVTYISDNAGSDDLRASFQSQPAIALILNDP